MPERIDAVMRIEAPVLDGDERLGHIVRQLVQRHRGAAHVAAGGERRAVGAEDQNRGRALGDFERLDRRQVDADPDQHADRADHGPEGKDRAPIDQPADAGAAFAAPRRGARLAFWRGERRFVAAAAAAVARVPRAGRRCGRPGAGGGRRRRDPAPVCGPL